MVPLPNIAKKLIGLVGGGGRRETTYNGTVVQIGSTYQVLIDGATTPTICTPEVKAIVGDRVTIEVRNHMATVKGNVTHPAANDEEALSQASRAAVAATQAEGYATAAANAATTAKQAASTALTQMSVIEDVSGTLAWISEHGSYVLTTDTTVQAGTVYFELVSGDYVPIATPDPTANPSQEGWYVLDVTDSQSDYIMAHLAVTSAGLWVLPTGIGQASDEQHAAGYKALFASSGMSVYDGTGAIVANYGSETSFYDGSGNVVAQFGTTARIGTTQNSHTTFSPNGIRMYSKGTDEFMSVIADNDPTTGLATVTVTNLCKWISQGGFENYAGIQTDVLPIVSIVSATLNGDATTVYQQGGDAFICMDASVGDELAVTYTTSAAIVHASFGDSATASGNNALASGSSHANGSESTAFGRETNAYGASSHTEGYSTDAYGKNSHAEGEATIAQGASSHAEGEYGIAAGVASHAEGHETRAKGDCSHAGGYGTIAASDNQTVFGKYNVEDTNGDYAFIIGNGSGSSSRSNAFAVGWDGAVTVSGHSSAIGTLVTASDTVSVASATGTAITSVTLDAGTWLIEGNVSFAYNATGRRIADLATGSGTVSAGVIAQTGVEVPAVSGGVTALHTGWMTKRTAQTTIYLNAYQTSGAALSVTGYIRAMRIQ